MDTVALGSTGCCSAVEVASMEDVDGGVDFHREERLSQDLASVVDEVESHPRLRSAAGGAPTQSSRWRTAHRMSICLRLWSRSSWSLVLAGFLSKALAACIAGAIPVPPARKITRSVSFGISNSTNGPRSSIGDPTGNLFSQFDTSPFFSCRTRKVMYRSLPSRMGSGVYARTT